MKTVILTDEQSLEESFSGIVGVIENEDVFKSESGFHYKLMPITAHGTTVNGLSVIEKHAEDGEFDTYVCFTPVGVTNGNREDNEFLFAEDGMYNPAIYADNFEFEGTLHTNATSNKKPAFVTEYRAPDEAANPAVFVFETINPNTKESYVQMYQGYRVRQDEVSIM